MKPEHFDEHFVARDFADTALGQELQVQAALGFPRPGELVDRYRIERFLAWGGMAAVFLAERADGVHRQQVALKLLFGRLNPESERLAARERQILATLTHPHIAHLIDGGLDERFGPFLVMEFVDGMPIDRYCAEHRLDVRARIELLVTVCDAVAHAHRQLVVHRDLKPTNVFVSGDGHVKLLDFGIAKLLLRDAEVRAGAASTHVGLTPEYAAPEQLLGEPVSTATDVYQLGLLLYELLTGTRPHAEHERSAVDLIHAVCHHTPPAPSSVVGARGTDPSKRARALAGTSVSPLARTLRGDLDSIVLTAIARQPEQRYASASDLSLDLRRHLRGDLVRARGASRGYRMRRLLWRQRKALAAALLVLSALGAALAVSHSQMVAAARQARRAEQVKHLLLSIFAPANHGRLGFESMPVTALLARAQAELETQAMEPATAGELLWVLGSCYNALGHFDDARTLLERAQVLRQQAHGPHSYEVAEVDAALGETAFAQRRVDDTLAHLQAALAIFERPPERDPRRVTDLVATFADALSAAGRGEEALALLHRRVRLLSTSADAEPQLAQVYAEIAVVLTESRQPALAESWYERAIEMEDHAGRRSNTLAQALHNLAALHAASARFESAERLLGRALVIQEERLGVDHLIVVGTRGHLGTLLEQRGKTAEAEALYRATLEKYRARLGSAHPLTVEFIVLLGKLLLRTSRPAAAEPLLREADAFLRHHPPDNAPDFRQEVAQALAECLTRLHGS